MIHNGEYTSLYICASPQNTHKSDPSRNCGVGSADGDKGPLGGNEDRGGGRLCTSEDRATFLCLPLNFIINLKRL